jgi:hypothetical protein
MKGMFKNTLFIELIGFRNDAIKSTIKYPLQW